jgi:two-component system phosphate regulon response regulator PhoB
MAKETILVVEDEEDIRELIRYNLDKEGYRIEEAGTGEEALSRIHSDLPSLVLLDLMLPELDGLEVCKRIKQDAVARHVPIVMLTAKGEESDIVAGLEVGADDYITKPFSPRVLLARVRAVLRRGAREPIEESDTIRAHELTIHLGRHEVLLNGEPVQLTNTEFQVLAYLARRPGWVFTRYQIVDAVHGENYPVTDRSVDVQIVGLRKKLGEAGHYIETVRGVGYRFRE